MYVYRRCGEEQRWKLVSDVIDVTFLCWVRLKWPFIC